MTSKSPLSRSPPETHRDFTSLVQTQFPCRLPGNSWSGITLQKPACTSQGWGGAQFWPRIVDNHFKAHAGSHTKIVTALGGGRKSIFVPRRRAVKAMAGQELSHEGVKEGMQSDLKERKRRKFGWWSNLPLLEVVSDCFPRFPIPKRDVPSGFQPVPQESIFFLGMATASSSVPAAVPSLGLPLAGVWGHFQRDGGDLQEPRLSHGTEWPSGDMLLPGRTGTDAQIMREKCGAREG